MQFSYNLIINLSEAEPVARFFLSYHIFREINMKKFRFLPLILSAMLLLSCLCLPAVAVREPDTAVPTALVIDRRSGDPIYSKSAEKRVYPADLTKLMTGLLAVEAVEAGRVSLNDMVTVTEAMHTAVPETGIRCGLQVGEQITLAALLQCMLIASADDAANMVADDIAGSVAEFVKKMNDRAASLGCTETHFSNVHGAYSIDHYTTAADFARIALECTKHERLMRLCGSSAAELMETNLSPARTLRNTNALVCDESVYGGGYVYEDANGLKAGFNEKSGYTLAATAARGGVELLVLIFGGEQDEVRNSAFSDAVTLLDWVFNNYAYQEVLKSTENIASVDVALGQNATYVNLRPATSITVLLPNDFNPDEYEKDIRVYALENGEPVKAPVTAGQVLGEVTLNRGSVSYGTVKLVASASVQLSRLQYMRQQIRETTRQRNFRIVVAVLAVLFLLYLIWVLIYRIKRLRHLYALRAAERDRALTAEAAMRVAEPKNPGIRFFDEQGRTSPPEPQPRLRAEPEPEPERPAPPPPELDSKIVSLFAEKPKPAAPEPEPAPAPEPVPAPAPAEDDLLAHAVLVAKLEPPVQREESAAEKAERDYFTEFFRPKK